MISGISLGASAYGVSRTTYNPYANASSNSNNLWKPLASSGTGFLQSLNSSSLSFLKSYQSSMTALQSATNALKASNTASPLSATAANSSNQKVATVQVPKGATAPATASGGYTIDVANVATAQQTTSAGRASGAMAFGDASFSITTSKGTFDINLPAKNSTGNAKTTAQLYNDIAKDINSRDMGLTASVQQKNGQSSLIITAKDTGADNSFNVSGDFAGQAGFATTTQATDANYTVTDSQGTSTSYATASNTVSLAGGQMQATLQGAGTTQVGMGIDTNKTISAVEDLVKSYNASLNLLSQNADRGAGVTRQMRNFAAPPIAERSLNNLGITTNRDGTLKLNTDTLRTTLTERPDFATELISGRYGLAENISRDAQSALNTSSNSLVANDMVRQQLQNAQDPTNMLSAYTRAGTNNMMNYYAVGVLMNMSV